MGAYLITSCCETLRSATRQQCCGAAERGSASTGMVEQEGFVRNLIRVLVPPCASGISVLRRGGGA